MFVQRLVRLDRLSEVHVQSVIKLQLEVRGRASPTDCYVTLVMVCSGHATTTCKLLEDDMPWCCKSLASQVFTLASLCITTTREHANIAPPFSQPRLC